MKNLEIYATTQQAVYINPIDVLEKLRDKAKHGWRNWVFEEDGKYFYGYEQSAGVHSIDMKEEITKEEYEHVLNLENCIAYLKEQEQLEKEKQIQ